MNWRLIFKEGKFIICIPLDILGFTVLMIFSILTYFWILGSLPTSILCIVRELAGEGSVAVAVGVSDR